MRLIDADALVDKIERYLIENKRIIPITIFEFIDNASTIEERPKGKWELFEKRPYHNLYMCSNCGHIIESMPDKLAENFKGCYCGARMESDV